MSTFITPSSPADQREISDAVKEASDSLVRTEAEKQLQKDIAESMKEKFNLKPRDFNRMVKVYHKQELAKITRETEEFQEIYTEIMKNVDPQLKDI